MAVTAAEAPEGKRALPEGTNTKIDPSKTLIVTTQQLMSRGKFACKGALGAQPYTSE